MEPNAVFAEVKGNLGGETVAMSVDAASMAHVMSILTDLYSDPVLAVIREYSTNAYDSHVEAGVKRPIEVSLPNAMSPFFKVRDYGVGLSVEDIRNVYSKYGASTKRSTNEQVGMLGLGCKSALTYTQQFTVRSVKDGKLAHVAISRTEDGSGVMQVVCIQDTDEENGVEISVPVHRQNDFQMKANHFFRFWEPNTVLVDGQEPHRFEGIDLGDGISLNKGDKTDYVIMGNVAYRVSSEHALYDNRYSYSRNFGVIAKVAIGSVNFTPSREDLHYTDHTIKTLEAVRHIVKMRLMDKAQEMINAKATRDEARQEWLMWRQMTGNNLSTLTYKGEIVPTEIRSNHLRYRPDYGRGSVSQYAQIGFNEVQRCIFVHGYERTDVPTTHRAKLRMWADQKGFSGRTFIITKEPIKQTWFTSNQVGSWEEVFATKKPREKREPSETYSVSNAGDRYASQKRLSELDKTKTFIIWSAGDSVYEDSIGDVLKLYGDAIGIKLAKNRWDKFLRENANAIKVDDAIRKIAKESFDALSADEKLSMSIDYYDRSSLCLLDASRLDDPELARYTRVVQSIKTTDAITRFKSISTICGRLHISQPTLDKVPSIKAKYPLLAAVNDRFGSILEHFYLYANLVHSTEVTK